MKQRLLFAEKLIKLDFCFEIFENLPQKFKAKIFFIFGMGKINVRFRIPYAGILQQGQQQ